MIVTENKVGEGHLQAAKAIEYAFKDMYGNQVETQIVYGLRCIHPAFEWLIINIYFSILKRYPKLWHTLYTKMQRPTFIQKYMFAIKLNRWLEQNKPDVILCTHPTCIAAFSYLKGKQGFPYKLGAVLTDYDFHPFIISENVDYYFVSHKSIKQKMVSNHHIEPSKIYDYGIPLLPHFSEMIKQKGTVEHNVYTNENKKKIEVLVLGGALGIGPIEAIIESFQEYQSDFSLTVICGRNEPLCNKLKNKYNNNIHILGYVSNMSDWISNTDIVISKPGGLTIAETLACGKPLFMVSAIPGQEEGNRQFLEAHDLGITVQDVNQLPIQIKQMMDNEKEWKALKQRINEHRQCDSAFKIVQTVTT